MVILGPDAAELTPPPGTDQPPLPEGTRAPSGDPEEPSTRPGSWLTLAALVVVAAFGGALRGGGLTSQGLWRDDAWVALSGHVGIGEAWQMWATAPGTYLVDRTVLVLGSGSTIWAQMPAFVAGIAAIPATYALARCFRLSRLAGVLMATGIALAPLCIIYSTRVKEYEVDILLSCATLAVGEVARRTPGARQLATLAVVSVVAFACSATVAVVIAGVWLAQAVATWRGRRRGWPRPVVVAAVAAVCGCAAVALIFYDEISPSLARFWAAGFVSHQSIGSFVSSLGWIVWHLLADAVGLGALSAPLRVVLLGLWLAIAVVGLRANRSMLAPALALVLAVLASVARVQPLGTGRTDQYLYPAVLLLTAAGITRIAAAIARDIGRRPRREVARHRSHVTRGRRAGPWIVDRPRVVGPAHLSRRRRHRVGGADRPARAGGRSHLRERARPLPLGAGRGSPSGRAVRLDLGRRLHGREHAARRLHRALGVLRG